MACPPFSYDTHGRRPIGYAQRLGDDWPLVDPSDDIARLVADLYLSFDDPGDYDEAVAAVVYPLSLAWLYGIGCVTNSAPSWAPAPVNAADLVILDADGKTVFDSTEAGAYASRSWGDRLEIHEWVASRATCRIVVHTKWEAADAEPAPVDYFLHIVPSDGRLAPQTCVKIPKRLRSVKVGEDIITGPFDLRAGYNTVLTPAAAPSVLRKTTPITLSFSPGAGEGLSPACADPDDFIKTINNESPTTGGDFFLDAKDCYWINRPSNIVSEEPRLASITANTLQIHNNCSPCCDCDDYVEMKYAIDALYTKWKGIAGLAEFARDIYAQNRTRFLEAQACRDTDHQRLTVVPACDGYVSIGYVFCGNMRECDGPLNITLTMTPNPVERDEHQFDLGGFLIPNLTKKNEYYNDRMLPYTLGGSWPVFTAAWEQLDNRHAAKLSMVLRFCNYQDGDTVTVGITGTYGGDALAAVSKTVAIEGACEIPEDACFLEGT